MLFFLVEPSERALIYSFLMDSKATLPPFVSFSSSISMSISNGQGEEERNLDVPCVIMGFMTGLDAAMHAVLCVFGGGEGGDDGSPAIKARDNGVRY